MKARPVTGMASRLVRVDHVEQRVRVTVDQYFVNWLDVAGVFTLHPQLVARSAPEPCIAGFDGVVKSFPAGIS